MDKRRRSLAARVCLPLVIATLAAVAPPAARSSGTALLTVSRRQARPPDPSLVQQMRVLQELDQKWLVTVPDAIVPQLSAKRVEHEVLDDERGSDVLFLVDASAASDVESLRELGRVWPLDGTNCLLAAGTEDVRERVAPHLQLKRLDDHGALTPTFEVPGTRAVARSPLAARAVYKSPIAEMVTQVSVESVASTIESLEAFQTRYASTPNCEAAGDWLFDAYSSMGLSVERDAFTFSNYATRNIVATLPGKTYPDQVIIVGAHYDSYSNNARVLAPGADDNASGTAAVLEIARVLSRYSFDYTIQFVGFSAEEWGLYGSRHLAQAANAEGRKIAAVINLDMVGYADRLPEDLDLIVNAKSEWLANTYTGIAALYAPIPTLKIVNPSLTYSDHAPFWDQGYSALCGIEDYNTPNPNYHKTYDSFGTLNMDFEGAVTRATLAVVATLAQPFVMPQPPSNVTAQAQTVATLLMRGRSVYLSWTPPPSGAAAYNVYRSEARQGPYQRINAARVTAASYLDRLLSPRATYYYVVTSVDASGAEGNYSREASVVPAAIR